jgi:hypothetical protein
VVAGTYAHDQGHFFWWKQNTAARYLKEGRRVIWTDDDIDIEGADDWLAEQDPAQVIWLSPDETVGITHEFIDQVEAWL